MNQPRPDSSQHHVDAKPPWLLGAGWRPLMLVLIALAMPMAVFALLIMDQVRLSLDEQAAYFNHSTAQLAGRVVQERFQGSSHYVESFAGRPVLRRAIANRDGEAAQAQLQALVEGHPGIDRAILTTPEGQLVHDFPRRPDVRKQDFSYRDWFQGVRRTNDTYLSGLYRRAAPPRHHIQAIATPVRGDDGRPLAYLVAQHTVDTLATWLNSLTPSPHSVVLLADPHGQLALPTTRPGEALRTLEGHELGERLGRGQHGALRAAGPLSGQPSLIETVALTSGWSVIVSQPLGDIHALLGTLNRIIGSLALAFAGGMGMLGLFWLRTVRRYQWERQAAAEELHARAAALEVANAELRQADTYKDEFLSVVSHELRTPLNGITGFASILQDEICGPLTPEQHQQVDRILAAGDRMLGLVNNLLEMSRIQAGKFQLSTAWVTFGAVAHAVHEAMAPGAAKAGVRLEVAADVFEERCLDGDRLRLALINLVDNAVKFTPAGGVVRIHAHVEDDVLRCEVSDTGVGLHPQDAARVFDRFQQADMSATRQAGGTGLGLSIVKAIVEAHGGRVGVHSTPGRGATFWFTIPELPGCSPR